VWFILEFYITQILIFTTSRFECISRLIKVTDNNILRSPFRVTVFTFMRPCIVINLFLVTNHTHRSFKFILHVSGIFSAPHQEFSTVHSALASFMQVFDERFQAESGLNCNSILTLLGSGHQKPGQRRCPKRVEFYNRIKLG
jgi:hypothetical protein